MAFGGEKWNRRQGDRAQREVKVVGACKDHMQGKVVNMRYKRADLKREIELKEAEVVRLANAGADEHEVNDMANEVAALVNKLEFNDGLADVFSIVRNVLIELETMLDALMEFEWYRYVIRTIPEKKLPAMIRSDDPKDLEKVMELSQQIIQKIEDKIVLTIRDKEKSDQIIRRIKATAEQQKAMYVKNENTNGKYNANVSAILAKHNLPDPVKAQTARAEGTAQSAAQNRA